MFDSEDAAKFFEQRKKYLKVKTPLIPRKEESLISSPITISAMPENKKLNLTGLIKSKIPDIGINSIKSYNLDKSIDFSEERIRESKSINLNNISNSLNASNNKNNQKQKNNENKLNQSFESFHSQNSKNSKKLISKYQLSQNINNNNNNTIKNQNNFNKLHDVDNPNDFINPNNMSFNDHHDLNEQQNELSSSERVNVELINCLSSERKNTDQAEFDTFRRRASKHFSTNKNLQIVLKKPSDKNIDRIESIEIDFKSNSNIIYY